MKGYDHVVMVSSCYENRRVFFRGDVVQGRIFVDVVKAVVYLAASIFGNELLTYGKLVDTKHISHWNLAYNPCK